MKNARMKSIRPFSKDDIPQVVDMFQRLLLRKKEGVRLQSRDLLPDYFEQIFFHNPWYDEEITSLVYENASGKIVGFLGVTPRPMLMQRHPIRMAISLHYMVEPESRTSLAGIHLLNAFFAGPQDLSLTDGAGKVGRTVWEGVGGMTTYLYSQRWVRILQPSQYIVGQLGKRTFAILASVLTPLSRLLDAGATRLVPKYFPKLNSKYSEEELETRTLLTHLPQLVGNRAIQPVYDDHSLQWVLNHARQMYLYGTLQSVLVRDQSGEVMGWYLYYLKSGGTSTVIQIVARKNSFDEILDHLFEHARQHGATALIGRLEAQYIQELSDKYCWFDRFSGWTLIHSKNSEVLHAIQRGDAFLSRLEGEWCLQF